MKWTKEKPKESGNYWHRDEDGFSVDIVGVEFEFDNSGRVYYLRTPHITNPRRKVISKYRKTIKNVKHKLISFLCLFIYIEDKERLAELRSFMDFVEFNYPYMHIYERMFFYQYSSEIPGVLVDEYKKYKNNNNIYKKKSKRELLGCRHFVRIDPIFSD